ncbi:MAG: hypothetical protein HZB20_07370 [Chloroflexi bacterium]|nr:hypothetical protein [Chloroflexota bacterium]MBI5829350.1 hypothetical protein [Chloroflexota bacterium]
MSLTEILPNLQKLERADKLRAIQYLIVELAKEDGVSLLLPQVTYPIWTPLNSFKAADSLLKVLRDEGDAKHG